MPSVQEELEALRKKKAVATHANVLQSKGGLSTPEQEEAALRRKAERDRQINYTKDAEKILKAGVKDAGLEVEFDIQQIKKKKEDASKKMEATQKLQSFRGIAEPGPGAIPKPVGASPAVTPRNLETGFSTPVNNTKIDEAVSEPAKETKTAVVDIKEDKAEVAAAKDTVPEKGDDAVPEKGDDIVPEMGDDAVPEMGDDAVPEMGDDPVPDMGDDAVPELGVDPAAAAAVQQQQQLEQLQQQQVRQPNRAEKKIRKAMQRLGMRPISGIARVTLKMAGKGNSYFAIHKPDVFEKNGTYIVFGEAMQGGGGAAQQQQATQAQAAQKFAAPPVAAGKAAPALPAVKEAEDDDSALDENGVEPKDIELVMSQGSCSRAQAVAALKDNDGDLVNAIMSLTT